MKTIKNIVYYDTREEAEKNKKKYEKTYMNFTHRMYFNKGKQLKEVWELDKRFLIKYGDREVMVKCITQDFFIADKKRFKHTIEKHSIYLIDNKIKCMKIICRDDQKINNKISNNINYDVIM